MLVRRFNNPLYVSWNRASASIKILEEIERVIRFKQLSSEMN